MSTEDIKYDLLDWLYNGYSQAIQVDRTARDHEVKFGQFLESLFDGVHCMEDIFELYDLLDSYADFLRDIRKEHFDDQIPDFDSLIEPYHKQKEYEMKYDLRY